jgi:hypothetical protein
MHGAQHSAALGRGQRNPWRSAGESRYGSRTMAERTVLARGAIFEISAQDDWVACEVVNRGDVSAEEGARCASQMNEVLVTQVLNPRSPYRGLLFDVRRGPAAFGPKTRAALEKLFVAAESSRRKLAVLVGESATQRMQFGNLSRERASDVARVFQTEFSAREWLQRPE